MFEKRFKNLLVRELPDIGVLGWKGDMGWNINSALHVRGWKFASERFAMVNHALTYFELPKWAKKQTSYSWFAGPNLHRASHS